MSLSVCPAILYASTMLEMCRHWCTHQNVEDCKLVDRLFSHSKFYARWSGHVCLATLGDGERWWQFCRPLMQLFISCDLVFLCEPSAPVIGRIHHAWILWSVDCQDRKCLAAIVRTVRSCGLLMVGWKKWAYANDLHLFLLSSLIWRGLPLEPYLRNHHPWMNRLVIVCLTV